jgi:uncharacterized phage-associated protein
MPHDAREIANFLLDHAESKGVPLTIMPLLKLIYFAHGLYLAKFNRPLINNHFEAWQYGPVVRVVYESFPGVSDDPITIRASKFDPVTNTKSLANYRLSEAEREFLAQIFGAYAQLHAFKLSDITHEPGSPWDEIWERGDQEVNPGMRIDNESIRAHFLRKHQHMEEH